MDMNTRREIQNMRMRSGRLTRDYSDHISGISPAVYCLFRCFLALAFFVAGITFPQISSGQIPKELTQIPEYVSASYTVEEVSAFIDGLAK